MSDTAHNTVVTKFNIYRVLISHSNAMLFCIENDCYNTETNDHHNTENKC